MDEKLKKWLYDVLKSIEEIEDYASQANRNFNRKESRNNIIHSYDTVSDEIIWSIVIKHIPKLKKEVSKLLNHQQ